MAVRANKKSVMRKKRGLLKDENREELQMMCGHPDCKYASRLFGGCCDFIEIEGHSRGCPADIACVHYKSGTLDKRRKLEL